MPLLFFLLVYLAKLVLSEGEFPGKLICDLVDAKHIDPAWLTTLKTLTPGTSLKTILHPPNFKSCGCKGSLS